MKEHIDIPTISYTGEKRTLRVWAYPPGSNCYNNEKFYFEARLYQGNPETDKREDWKEICTVPIYLTSEDYKALIAKLESALSCPHCSVRSESRTLDASATLPTSPGGRAVTHPRILGWTPERLSRESGVSYRTILAFIDNRLISGWAEHRIKQTLAYLGVCGVKR